MRGRPNKLSSDDLVQRLRELTWNTPDEVGFTISQAADEIERLTRELQEQAREIHRLRTFLADTDKLSREHDRLRAALERIAAFKNHRRRTSYESWDMMEIAREALRGEK